jgi:hypothetical protein
MEISKLPKMSLLALSVINGVVFGVMVEFCLRLIFILKTYSDDPFGFGRRPVSWWYLPVLSLATVTIAAVFAHIILGRIIKSTVWFWQSVGVTTIVLNAIAVVIFIFFQLWTERQIHDEIIESALIAVKDDWFILFLAFPILQLYNLIFALVLNRFRLYLP